MGMFDNIQKGSASAKERAAGSPVKAKMVKSIDNLNRATQAPAIKAADNPEFTALMGTLLSKGKVKTESSM